MSRASDGPPYLRHQSPRWQPRSGAAMLETAAVLATWIVLLVGILDLGLVLLRHNLLQRLATQAARLTSVRGANASPQLTPWGPSSLEVSLNQQHPVAALLRPMTGGFDPAQFQVRIEWLDGGNQSDQRVRVQVNSSQPTALSGVWPGGGSLSLQSSALARINP